MDKRVSDECKAYGHCHRTSAVRPTADCDEVFGSLILLSFSNGMKRKKLPPTRPAVTISAAITSINSEFFVCMPSAWLTPNHQTVRGVSIE